MFYPRYLSGALASRTSHNKVRLLFGARQVGKTEILKHLVAADRTALFDLSSSAQRLRFEADPARFGREARALPPVIRNIVVDEIQKAPELLDEVQNLYDTDKNRFQFYLTGSSARNLRRHSSNLLPGRSHLFRLLPVCRWEAEVAEPYDWLGAAPRLRAKKPDAAVLRFPDQSLERTLLFGNLPGIRQESATAAAATLSTYVENYLESEIRREALVRDLGAFAVFLRLAAVESGRQVNLAKLSQESGVPASSLKNYYQVLEETFTGFWMHSYGRPGRKRLLSTPRFYIFDTGVRNAAAEYLPNSALVHAEGATLLEQWIGLELLYRAAYRGTGYDVAFWRSASGAEVDFVWQTPREDVPVEVKWTSNPRSGDARHLETFLSEYPRRARRGLIVCRCERPEQISKHVVAIPWSML